MGVYIKEMEIPKSCPCKLVGVGYDLYCSFTSGIPSRMREYRECCEKEKRPDWCPLVEVPPHGRLIDADAFEKENAYFWNRDFINPKYEDTLADLVNAAPTIIEAEGET